MNKVDIITFFDKMSKDWDRHMVKNQDILNYILDCAEVKEGATVLDVACGTGVMISEYLNRNVKKVVGIDLSPKMIEIAREKYADCKNVSFFIGDMEEIDLQEYFDCIVVYNAFPHFCNPEVLMKKLAEHLVEGGTACIAHGISRAKVDSCHNGPASHVSNGLIHEDEMAKLMSPYFEVHTKISNQQMYVVAGRKR